LSYLKRGAKLKLESLDHQFNNNANKHLKTLQGIYCEKYYKSDDRIGAV